MVGPLKKESQQIDRLRRRQAGALPSWGVAKIETSTVLPPDTHG